MRNQEASDQNSAAGRRTASAEQISAPPPCRKRKGDEDKGAVKETSKGQSQQQLKHATGILKINK